MKKISFILLLTLCSLIGFGQQFRTGNAPMKSVNTKMSQVKQANAQNIAKAALNGNFVATDINGVEHNLQTYLDAGKTVFIDLFGYWCGPCWQLHNSGALEDFYNTYGPAGTDEAVILMVETTSDCTLALLQGTGTSPNGDPQGNWTLTAGGANQVPIIMNSACYYGVFGNVTDGYVPNVVMVCPSGQAKLLDSYGSAAALYANIATCMDATDLAVASIVAPGSASIGENVTFESLVETVAPITAYAWTINGGTPATATTEDATATFAAEGTYTITLEVTNANGTTTATHEITIVDCTIPFTYDFEACTNFVVDNFSPCTTSDGDLSSTYGAQDFDFTNESYTGSFIAFNPSQISSIASTESWQAHGGNKYGACFAATTPPNNDWFILPRITVSNSGTTFKFWAKSLTEQYGKERFTVNVSTTTNAVSSFSKISSGTYTEAPTTWTEYSYNLSNYTGQQIYLAIHCVSNDAFVFQIDDISVTSNMISENFYIQDNVNIYPNPSTGLVNISVSEFSNVEIYDITGKMIDNFSINANETHSFTQSAGMYIVKINNEVQKIVIE